MSARADLLGKSTKTCFVVLEKLDDKLISQYLQKYSLKKTTTNDTSVKNAKRQLVSKNVIRRNICFITEKSPEGIRKNKRENSEGSVISNKELKRKKKKFKASGLKTDDASKKSVFENKETVTEGYETKKLSVASEIVDDKKEWCEELKEADENDKSLTMKSNEKSISEVEEKRNDVILKTFPKAEKAVVELSNADPEIEVIEEHLNHRSNSQNESCHKTEANNTNERLHDSSDFIRAKIFEEDEFDLREDNEDDKKTVIFEEKFPQERDLDILDIDETKIDLPKVNSNTREIKNVELRELLEFGKGVESGNSEGKVKEPSIRRAAPEVLPLLENISEDYLNEVCCLIQRLYELYRIILHMQLELQNNNRLSVHFLRAINAQQEKFQRQIRNSQNTIIKGYEKMLLYYKNADKVALIISKRTSLNPKEVIEVISQCLILEGACKLKKSSNESVQKAGKEKVFQPFRPSCDSDGLRQIINSNFGKAQKPRTIVERTNYFVSPSHSYFPSRENPESCQKLTKDSTLASRAPIWENPKIRSQNLSDHMIGIPPPELEVPRIKNEMLRCYLMQKRKIEKNQMKNSGISQTQQAQHHRPLLLLPNGHPAKGFALPGQNVLLPYPKSGCLDNGSQFQRSSLHSVPSAPVGNKGLLFPKHFPNCNPCNSSANRFDRINSVPTYSRSGPFISNVVGNTTHSNTLQHQNVLLSGAYLSKIHNGRVNAQRQILTPSHETRVPFEVSSMDSTEFQNEKFVNVSLNGLLMHPEGRTKSRFTVDSNVRTGSGNVPSRIIEDSFILDPTVPKKLTMKNWRLQAGPVLNLRTEREKVADFVTNFVCDELENADREEPTTREYVCAQNDCRKPGIRICGGCQSIIYCSEACQLKDWQQKHMIECHQLRKLRG